MSQVHVFAITGARASHAAAASLPRLEVVRAGRLAAIVAARHRRPAVTTANLRRHHQVIESITRSVPAILPVRFGTMMSADEIAIVLRSREPSLLAQLAVVRGCVQITIRVLDDVNGERAITAAARGWNGAATRSGTAYLRARAADVRRASEVRGFRPVRAAVARWVHEERVAKGGGVASIYHLVSRRSVAAYTQALMQGARAAGLVIAVSGPFPPFAFADPVLS